MSIELTTNWAHSYFVDWTVVADTVSTVPTVALVTVATQQSDSAQLVEARFCRLR